MLLTEYVGHNGHRNLTDGHLGRHLEYFKTLNDARVASVGFIKYNASTTRINKEKNFKIKFQVILVFHRTILSETRRHYVTALHWLTSDYMRLASGFMQLAAALYRRNIVHFNCLFKRKNGF